jgi:hypothetical protein
MESRNYIVEDVSDNPDYWDKDIDFIITSPTSGETKTFEVKWDSKIHKTGNLYLELANKNSKNGNGWYEFCKADLLAYGDAKNGIFYIIPMAELRAKAKRLPKDLVNCGIDSIGQLVPLSAIKDIVQVL